METVKWFCLEKDDCMIFQKEEMLPGQEGWPKRFLLVHC